MSYAYDPELAPLIELLPAPDLADLAGARALIDGFLESVFDIVDASGVVVSEHQVPGAAGQPDVAARVYRAEGAEPGPLPAVLAIHGGGFVLGSMAVEHPRAVRIAREVGAVVIVVGYRLAPEHPYPAALEDCFAALAWIHDEAGALGVDPARVGVMGESAGGGLAAALALLARDRGGPALCFQLLAIPELDDRFTTTSMAAFVDTPLWNRPNAVLSWQHYLRGVEGEVPAYAAPARATDLAGLPPAYLTAMEFDPLRDEGILYALRLLEAGVSVELHTFPGTFHASTAIASAAVSQRADDELFGALRRGLGG